ncbi:uncharacterized protein LOC124281104 [Haliotis rubra]|uniref:uncharacterized protein LOC124281104 n=1 Tax=Haliotis rubra TaxID=36100 RepID=UPI001EE5AB4C|nr:uncharacterized protein LOC124281104 [Haliotis rubra]
MPGKTKMPSSREAKVCVSCLRTSSQSYACARCYLVTYCSQRCCDQHWSKHKDDCKFVTWHRRHVGWNFCHSCFAHACPHASYKLKRCGGCLRVSYCSRECQDNDWRYHAPVCTNDKNRERPKYTIRFEDLPLELQERDLRDRAINAKAEEEMEKSNAKKKGKKKQKSVTEENSEVGELETQLMRDKQFKQLLRQKGEEEKRSQLQRFQCQVSPDGSVEPEIWEKKWKQSKIIPSLTAKGQTSSHAIEQTRYRVRLSNTAPVLHEGFQRNPDNTNSYEEEIEEKLPDGTITRWKTIITNGVIENDAQLEEITRRFGVDFSHHPGGTLADPDYDSD